MKKIISIIAALIAVCFLLTGCSGTPGIENSELMRPPRATGERAEIQDVIDNSAGGPYTFKYPQGGDYRSAIIMYDLTGDGEEEAIAIYRTSGDEAETHVILIDELNGVWSLVGDFRNSSPEISQVIFSDLDGDGADEVIIGYSTYSSLVSSLAVYSYDGLNSRSVTVNETYSNLIIGDFTGSGLQEIVLVSMENSGIPAGAKLMYYSKEMNSLTARSAVEMDSGVSKFLSIGYCRVSENIFGIAVDGQSVDNNCYTQLIYYDKMTGRLCNSLYDAQNENKSMHRQEASISSDIDGDGVIEVPIVAKMPFDSAAEVEELVANETVYYEYNTDEDIFIEEGHFIINPDYGYFYRIPEELVGGITARVDPSAGTLAVFTLRSEITEGTAQTGTLIFTLGAFDAEQWDKVSGYEAVAQTDSYIIGLAIPEGNPLKITKQEIKSAIMIMDSQ